MDQAATILITNASVYTFDDRQPVAEAVAVRGNQVVFVGSTAEAGQWRGPRTEIIDAGGTSLLPGFIDSHYHLLSGSLELDGMQLDTVKDAAELARSVSSFAALHPEQEWLLGRGLRYSLAPAGRSLDRHMLDSIEPDRPLFLVAYDGHTAWANSEALRRANLLGGRDVGPNGQVVMDPATGLATGELRESPAFDAIEALLPPPDEAQKRTLLHKGLAQAAALGITSIHNMDGDAAQLALYAALEDMGEMTLRIYCPYSVSPETPVDALAEAVQLRENHHSGLVRAGCVKFFMDGVIESYTALMLEVFAGQPGNRGSANFSADHFRQMAVEADRLGLQIFVHAIGDAAVRRTLDGFEQVQQINGRRDSRHRIEHIEVIHPDDIHRFAQLGVIASMQPLHAPMQVDETDIWPARVGSARWPLSFAWQTLRQGGARLVFGSDWPVVSASPMLGLHSALNRRPWLPTLPDQRQVLADALAAYTKDAAYAEFQEERKGVLRAGLLADLVLLSADIFSTPPEAIQYIRPRLTVCDGRIVYRDGI